MAPNQPARVLPVLLGHILVVNVPADVSVRRADAFTADVFRPLREKAHVRDILGSGPSRTPSSRLPASAPEGEHTDAHTFPRPQGPPGMAPAGRMPHPGVLEAGRPGGKRVTGSCLGLPSPRRVLGVAGPTAGCAPRSSTQSWWLASSHPPHLQLPRWGLGRRNRAGRQAQPHRPQMVSLGPDALDHTSTVNTGRNGHSASARNTPFFSQRGVLWPSTPKVICHVVPLQPPRERGST